MYKITHKLCPDYLHLALSRRSDIHDYYTRNVHNFDISARRTAQSCKSFLYCAPLLYDSLPEDIKQAKSIDSFRKKCRNLIFVNQINETV